MSTKHPTLDIHVGEVRQSGMSLTVRAVLTIGLMVLFYSLAIVVSIVLVLAGLLLLQALPDRANLDIVLAFTVCFLTAGIIAWSVLPRFDRFKAPGPEITAHRHPQLFTEILAVAAATRQRMPDHVYLISEVNAFVAQRGGIMGIGSRRVMAIGLPLLRALQVDELRAVLAHEMGHFYGGDTKLGPWIYKIRSGLTRTVTNLTKMRQSVDHWTEQSSIAHWGGRHLQDHWLKPQLLRHSITEQPVIHLILQVFVGAQVLFRWFLIGFIRISQAISRIQEHSADAVAVRAEGSRAFVDGLKKTHAASIAHAIYMRTQILPLVKQGALPAVGEGFSRFLHNDILSKLLSDAVAAALEDDTTNPYDSHPPLRIRIAAVTAIRGPNKPPDPRLAIELIEDAERIECDELASHVDRKLKPVNWNETENLWIASWHEEIEQAKLLLTAIRVDDIPGDPRYIYRLMANLIGLREADTAYNEGIGRWWISTISAALAVMLLDAGFAVTTRLGEPFRFTRGDVTVDPFVEFVKLITGETSQDAWRTRWAKLGFADRRLAVKAAGI